MSVYLFTYHAYGTWMPDHRDGFTQRDVGYQPPNPSLANAYKNAAAFDPYHFDEETKRFLIEMSQDVCRRRGWRLHNATTEPTHLHDLVSWRDGIPWEQVRGKIKNILSLELSKRANVFGRPWFVDGSSRKHVENDSHFEYLMETYLPDHGGWRWDERVGWTAPRAKRTAPKPDDRDE